MRPLLADELPRTRSSLRGSSQEGGAYSSTKREVAATAWNSTTPSTRVSFLVTLAVAAGVALGLLFGARDALIRGAAGAQSTLAGELAERLESQVIVFFRAHRKTLARSSP